ncbi:MAG: hypothetical protein KDD62_09260, partial [Bdellovibrionales bacterium]|nr:hypothetical protein [Bdellovibrionales bacterium]
TQRQYDRWLRSLNSAKSDYIKLAETYADLTGHQVDYGDPSEIQNREQASAFVDSQHQQAQEALGNAFTIAQRDYMEVRAGVADFDWVEDPNLQGLLEVKPELYTQFQSERSARDQAHAVEEFFTSSRYQEFGIDRTSINPHNGVVGVVAAGSPPVELSVEEQISRALDPAVRRIDQDRRMADPVGQPHRSQYLESMQDVVEVFGTQSEKQQLSQMIRQENAAYFDRIDEIRDAAQAQRDTQREQERQARREELHRQNVDDYVRYSRSGSGRNNPALSSLRQSRQVVSDASRELARFNPEQRIREEVAAGIQQNRAREEADRAAHNIDFARSLEGRFRAHGSPIDLSERIDELQGRAALAETRAEAFGAIAQDTTSPAAREAREFLEGTEQTWQQTLDNMAQLDPQEETPIPTQELPEEVQQRVEENLERESSALFNSLHKLFENMSTATNQERAFSERLEIITAETFDTSSLALPESITVEQLVANLEEQRAEAEQTIVGLEASINELLRGADQNLLQRAAAIASRKMSDDDDLFTPLVSRTIEETLDNRRDEP